MATDTIKTQSWIKKTPNVCGGDACIRNTRITVYGLVHYQPPVFSQNKFNRATRTETGAGRTGPFSRGDQSIALISRSSTRTQRGFQSQGLCGSRGLTERLSQLSRAILQTVVRQAGRPASDWLRRRRIANPSVIRPDRCLADDSPSRRRGRQRRSQCRRRVLRLAK